jgi:ParB family transcriptional regulator, chromosome partitioning protein
MTETEQVVEMIPVEAITVLNPRTRNRRIFNELVASISAVGLKRPVTIRRRTNSGAPAYDLVCGQGRLEACQLLGQKEIPAVVIDASEHDCYVMSLVENLARRTHSAMELMQEIGAMRDRGYQLADIALKIGVSYEYVTAICFLLDNGEDRLIKAVDSGQIPATIAVEIARAKESDVQTALADAYESGSLPGRKVLAIRRIIEQRNLNGKTLHDPRRPRAKSRPVTAVTLVRAYKKETERQRLMVKKATLTQSRLTFIVNAMRRLLDDKAFVQLAKAEGLSGLPRPLAGRLTTAGGSRE